MTDTGPRVRRIGPPRQDIESYPTVARAVAAAQRLARRHPDRCRVREVGRSRAGRPLVLLSVDDGEHTVLAVGGPHPNEPVGMAAAVRLAERVLELPPRPGVGWHVLLCLDPDGAALNEGWLHGPLTPARHYEHFFRPAFDEQPELPPAPDGDRPPMPESRALTGLIDELRPVLQCSLHGVDFGGAFVQLTRPLPGLAEGFARSVARAGIPLDVDSYDAVGWDSPAPGAYVMPAPGGGSQALPDRPELSTWSYAGRYGGVTAVLEVPMWAIDAVGDSRPYPDARAAVGAAARTLGDRVEELVGMLPQVPPHAGVAYGPLLRSIEFNLEVCPLLLEEWRTEWSVAPLSVSRVTTARIVAARLPLRVASMLLRLLADSGGPAADAARARARAIVAASLDGLHRLGTRWVPVDAQVSHQARAALAAADLLLPV
ncbi:MULTISPECIES: M14 family zinc carboxypeptidase [unclassified Streptomyces]|uniref:M14 family zinc carboxypeptidase n=1 Tax=Streptomycetaceae TaxID=2062 RepID=UPI002E7A0C9D|nr:MULTISPECIES: M14 family zinc carboxypeptidase [unclassified Streptomyces]MED7953275.1 M14 family zinc carboxypeptidase [Streptomyces sp. BE303]MEE1828624.1 M14 family zinc carboxypeptidase [Streptomyces sp. BE20]